MAQDICSTCALDGSGKAADQYHHRQQFPGQERKRRRRWRLSREYAAPQPGWALALLLRCPSAGSKWRSCHVACAHRHVGTAAKVSSRSGTCFGLVSFRDPQSSNQLDLPSATGPGSSAEKEKHTRSGCANSDHHVTRRVDASPRRRSGRAGRPRLPCPLLRPARRGSTQVVAPLPKKHVLIFGCSALVGQVVEHELSAGTERWKAGS